MKILNERPKDMSYEDYKTHMKAQKAWIKERKKGILYYKASEIYYAPADTQKLFGLKSTYNPFVGEMKKIEMPIQ